MKHSALPKASAVLFAAMLAPGVAMAEDRKDWPAWLGGDDYKALWNDKLPSWLDPERAREVMAMREFQGENKPAWMNELTSEGYGKPKRSSQAPAAEAQAAAPAASSHPIEKTGDPKENYKRHLYGEYAGYLHATALTALTEQANTTRGILLGRTGSISNGGAPGLRAKPGFWSSASGTWSQLGEGRWQDKTNSQNYMLGVDRQVSESTQLGVALGIGKNRLRSPFEGGGQVDTRSNTLALYGGTRFDDLRLSYGAAYSWHTIKTKERRYYDSARTNYSGTTAQLFGEAAYDFRFGQTTLQPYLGLAYVRTKSGEFKESGGGTLRGGGAAQGLTFSTLGLRAAHTWSLSQSTALTLDGGVGWRHAFGDVTPSTRMRFADGYSAYAWGTPISRDALVTDVGLTLASGNATVRLGYSGQFGKQARSNSAMLNVGYAF